MVGNNMTDSDIVKGMRICLTGCTRDCPYINHSDCMNAIKHDSLNLYCRLQIQEKRGGDLGE